MSVWKNVILVDLPRLEFLQFDPHAFRGSTTGPLIMSGKYYLLLIYY